MPMDHTEFETLAAQVRLLVLDVDGVMTDGRLHYDADGREQKVFHVRDGYGIKQVLNAGIEVAVISGRQSRAVQTRINELGIQHAFLGQHDKLDALNDVTGQLAMPLNEVVCIGDDSPDLAILAAAGIGIAVADAHPSVLAQADWVTRLPGGLGAVREVCDLLIDAKA
jgi:3-deoxy-D-manno-octulosonate 8-phosphate phosphatase (KDO 8-P phosphatase)